jgi:ribosomal protein S1
VYRLGDKVNVQVVRVDMERRQVDLGIVDILEAARREERGVPVRSKVKPKRESFARVGAGGSSAAAGFSRPDRKGKKKQRPGKRERAARKGEPHGRSRGGRRR